MCDVNSSTAILHAIELARQDMTTTTTHKNNDDHKHDNDNNHHKNDESARIVPLNYSPESSIPNRPPIDVTDLPFSEFLDPHDHG